jgi:hypothetical protein
VSELVGIEGVEGQGGHLREREVTELRVNVLFDMLGVSLGRPRRDGGAVAGQPLVEVRAECQLAGIRIGAVVDLAEQATEFLLRFRLGAVHRFEPRPSAAGDGIRAGVVLDLPRAGRTLAHASITHFFSLL